MRPKPFLLTGSRAPPACDALPDSSLTWTVFAADQSQPAEPGGALCRGVSCRRRVRSGLHDLSHQSGAPLLDQGAGNLGNLEHRPLPMLRLLQERASGRERET